MDAALKQKTTKASVMRIAMIACLPFLAAACTTVATEKPAAVQTSAPKVAAVTPVSILPSKQSNYKAMYAAVSDGGNNIPAIDLSKTADRNLRKQVNYKTHHPVGTIIVDPYARYLYLVEPNGKAMRYSVGVGRAGLAFTGEAKVAYKAKWPRWTPTANMIKRNPDHYAKYAKGVEGGIKNPLGARALYLYRDGKDTLYRIHGTNEAWSVGKAASSGCIRLFNQDILDLHKRVSNGSNVVVLSQAESGKGEN